MTTLTIPSIAAAPFVMIEAGARDTRFDRSVVRAFPHLQVVGFEPDPDECRRLADLHGAPHRFLPLALGRRPEQRILYRTPVPHYASLFPPDPAILAPCWERDLGFFPVEETEVHVVDLDSVLSQHEIRPVHFMQLDTQGGELEALHGAAGCLQNSVLGVRVEVFLTPLYAGQPLFGDIERFLHCHGFQLFALDALSYRLHRRGLPPNLGGPGQPVALDALYLRDYHTLLPSAPRSALSTLAVLASALGFHDYAVQIVQALLDDAGLEAAVRAELIEAQRPYVAALLADGDRSR